MGETISTITIATGILFEILGPALTKIALKRSGAMTQETVEKVKSGVIKVDYGSVLQDMEILETPERTERLNKLKEMKDSVDKANRYIHTKEYNDRLSKEDDD